MNTRPKGPAQGGDEVGRGWNETGVKNEAHRREEILELLWTLREMGKSRLDEILPNAEEREAERILSEMDGEGWISIRGGRVDLLREGERRAEEIIRRHRLAERLLSEVFELEESHMESSACQFEHILSPKVLDSVCTFLGHPPICPHGKPIPRGPCCARFSKEMEPLVRPLADLKPGEEGRVVFITPKSRSRLERLSALGLIPGSVVKLAQKHPSFVLEIGETTLALDEEIVREIYVKRV
jgi:DtxR family Mn-dependent transcriptional regulator